MEEKVFLSGDGVNVTSTRIEVGGQTFATRNVGSVKIEKPGVSLMAVLLLAAGIFLLFASEARAIGFLMAAGGGLWTYMSAQLRQLRLMAGGGEVVALKSRDSEAMQRIHNAIAEAIAMR